jgi:tRNA (adenine57-N1/adenine58-N1)-methyltransferase catalytic subunit
MPKESFKPNWPWAAVADRISDGDAVLLLGSEGERHLVRVRPGTHRVAGFGVIDLGNLLGRSWGDRVTLGGTSYVLLAPILADHLRALERRAQIITPKDAARILLETGAAAGRNIAEAGVGSGALTVALAHAVAPTGRVFGYDVRADHLEVARRNVEAAGLGAVVEFRQADVRSGIQERDLDAVVLDLPEPEAVIASARDALRAGGVLAAYVPTAGQLEAAARATRGAGFLEVRMLELLERPWVVHDRGTRPDFDMLGHTGFLLFARRG